MTTSPLGTRREAAGPPSKEAGRPSRTDPWLWLTALAVLPLLARAWGAPLGEPAADDYHFLHRALLAAERPLFDGGGAVVYWRPLSRQVYFGLLGPLMLEHPRAIAMLHAGLLALAAVLIYRVLRRHWSGPWAAAAATFPWLAESSRTLLSWPSAFQDLGAILFSALALHQAARRRTVTALVALLAGLLCKEIAVVAALLLPWMPTPVRGQQGERRRWVIGVAGALALWGAAYAPVILRAEVVFQRHLEVGTPPFIQRLAWALVHGLDDAFGLAALPVGQAVTLGTVAALLLAVATGLALRSRAGRARSTGWMVWGAAWFLGCTATLSEVWPLWGPFRGAIGMLGLGIACVALMRAAGSIGLGGLVALRLVALALTPAPPPFITQAPPRPGAALDFESLARLQRFAAETRATLVGSYPTLPRGSAVGELHRPLMAEHAFAHGKALQVWYRDTTLRWVTWTELKSQPVALAAAVEYEPHQRRQVALVSPEALRQYLEAVGRLHAEDCVGALASLDRADSLQGDRGAAAFLGLVEGKRALARLGLGDLAGARAAAETSLARWSDGADSRYVLATLLAAGGRTAEARAQLDTLLMRYPYDAWARELLDSLRAGAPP